jgi:hypothetical protein
MGWGFNRACVRACVRVYVGFALQIHHDQMEVSRFPLSVSATPALFRSAILEPLTRKDQFVGHLSRSHSLLCVVDDLHCPWVEHEARPSALLELLRQLMTHSQYNEPGKSDATVVSSLNFVACGDWTVATTASARLHRQWVAFTLADATCALRLRLFCLRATRRGLCWRARTCVPQVPDA